ncbi:MAG: hypothetical protein EOP08_02450 [Proteobacteria bacterium]|nr:MAG: hypothetical protein EOP08_02450 [Pseudomonadota bacterium]
MNLEAGSHAVSVAPGHADAAAAATRRSWRSYPYYAARYGERGWRFSLSDSGWLQTLLVLPEPDALAQMRWLRGLLRARGMPSVLLESHLGFLAEELTVRGTDGDPVRHLADDLRRERLAQIDAAQWSSRCAALPESDDPGAVRNLAPIFLSALIDERDAPGTAANVRAWVGSDGRSDAGWLRQLDTWLIDCATGIGSRYATVGHHHPTP